MRQIEVEVEVFALIWANRRPPEINENEILKRLLREIGTPTAPMVSSPRSPLPPQPGSNHDVSEVFSSNLSKDEALTMPSAAMIGKVRWVDDIVQGLRQLGGVASLHRIYRAVENIRKAAGRSVPKSLEATVRQCIESHSKDSENFRGEDLFRKIGRGEWALTEWQESHKP